MIDGIDPARVSVISVGVESYEYGSKLALPGAADEAARFVRWAIARGVPPDRIVFACSHSTDSHVEAGVAAVEAKQADLERIVVDMAKLSGDLLLLFWCGHGVLREKQRVLFTADARVDYLRGLDLDQVLDYLRSVHMTGFARQIVLVDACANYVEEVDSTGLWRDLVRPGNLPGGMVRASVNQFVLLSAAQGQAAQFQKLQRHALFSDAVLAWLEDHATGDLPFAVDQLTKHVTERFEAFRDSKATRQTPVSLWYRTLDGSESWLQFGGEPVSGSVQSRLQDAELPVAAVRRVATVIVDIMNGADGDDRELLLDAARLALVAGETDRPLLIAAVIDELSDGRATELFRALIEAAATEEDRLALHDTKRQWKRLLSLAPIHQAFGQVGLQDVKAAYYWAVPPSDTGPAPRDLDEAFDRAAAYSIAVEDISVSHRFVALLEQAASRAMEDAWFNVPDASLRALRAEAAAAHTKAARFVIDLDDPEAPIGREGWPSTVMGHLCLSDTAWRSTTVPCSPDLFGVQQGVADLLDWVYNQGVASFTLGLIVSRRVLDEMPETWEFGDEMTGKLPLWRDRPTVMHSAERRKTPRASAYWREKAESIQQRLQTSPTDILWIKFDDRDAPDRIREAVHEATAAAIGLEFVAEKCATELHRDPIIAMVAAGAPYVVWVGTEPDDWSETRRWVHALAEQGDFADLPQRLHEERIKAPERGCQLRLIWDDPGAVPPTGQLSGLATGGGHHA